MGVNPFLVLFISTLMQCPKSFVEGCGKNEDKISLQVSVEFFEQSLRSASSYTKTVISSSTFKKTLNKLAVSASASGSYGGFSAEASTAYESLTDSVLSVKNYTETIKSDTTEYNTGFLQIIREIETRVSINGISASSTERKFVDSVATDKPLSSSELKKRAEDYLEFLFGSGKSIRNKFTETVCQQKRADIYAAFPYGPKCEMCGYKSVDKTKCQEVARSLGFNGTLGEGSWSWAPFGCFAGNEEKNWGNLYYNKQSGETGRSLYKTFCNVA